MSRQWTDLQLIERSIHKRFRKELWTPMITAVKRYDLIQPDDRIAVCISGGKDSMLMAVMLRLLQRYSDFPFALEYLVMDPGYRPENLARIHENAERLGLPVTVFQSGIFDAAYKAEQNPCYLCARMRRGSLYAKARELGCGKIALGHHLNDVIETTVMGMFYGSQLQGMMPKLRSDHFPGMELIRPLYRVLERDIIAWQRYNQFEFLQCACKMTERDPEKEDAGKRREVKRWIETLRKTEPDIELRLFASLHSVNISTFPGWKEGGQVHSFLEKYGGQPAGTDSV